jgi:hypothetical protein
LGKNFGEKEEQFCTIYFMLVPFQIEQICWRNSLLQACMIANDLQRAVSL